MGSHRAIMVYIHTITSNQALSKGNLLTRRTGRDILCREENRLVHPGVSGHYQSSRQEAGLRPAGRPMQQGWIHPKTEISVHSQGCRLQSRFAALHEIITWQ